jgi:hypothetical protein
VAANGSIDGAAIIGGGGGVFVDATPLDTGTMEVNGERVPLSPTALTPATALPGGEVSWTLPFVHGTASFGSNVATSPRRVQLRCLASNSAALRLCPPTVTLQRFQRDVVVQLLDAFGQHVTSQFTGWCTVSVVTASAAVAATGAISPVSQGSCDFPSLNILGRRGDYYPLSVTCTLGSYVLELPAEERLQVQMPLCSAGEEPTEDKQLCRPCGAGTFSVDGSRCVGPDAGHFSKDARFQGVLRCCPVVTNCPLCRRVIALPLFALR